MVQEQADLASGPRAVVDYPEEVMQLDERHVRVDILDVGGEERILKLQGGQRKDLLLDKILPVLG